MTLIRAFVAIPVTGLAADKLSDQIARLAGLDKSHAVSWVNQENLHITLAFLGDQAQTDLENMADQLDSYLGDTPFNLNISHTCPFPESRPKLLAAMIEKNPELQELQQRVTSAASASDISVQKRRFIPHITLGRFRHSKNKYFGGIPISSDLSVEVEEVILYESILTANGAIYEPLFRFPFHPFSF